MPSLVTNGAQMRCTFGIAPSALVVPPLARVTAGNQPAATIMDYVPMTNVMPFGMCQTPSNPQVAAATAAASGVLTPQPCIPVLPAPWSPGAAQTLIASKPALTNTSMCTCAWGGVITITSPGQTTVNVS